MLTASGVSPRQALQEGDRFSGALVRHEQMVMMEAGDDIAAQAGIGEFPRYRSRQAYSLKRRMHAQRDPARNVPVRQAGSVGVPLWHDQREALRLGDRDNGGDAGWDIAGNSGEHVAAGIQHRAHAAEQPLQVALASHGQHLTDNSRRRITQSG